jgi:hypothetical protein
MPGDGTEQKLGDIVATDAAIMAKALGIDLPEWAYNAIREHPEHAGVISDAVCVQAGLIRRT